MRKQIIAGNWKLNKTVREAIELITLLKRANIDESGPEVIVCPVFTALSEAGETCSGSIIKLGAQNMYWQESGAFTGEVSGSLLKDAGCSHVIIGHSERRQFFGETDETVNKKLRAAIANGLTPVVCCGELLEEREEDRTDEVVERQIRGAFAGVPAEEAAQCVIAYEPVWAIGTGKVATPDQAQEVHAFIRGIVKELYQEQLAENVRILYGGSVKPSNAEEILRKQDVDGALVGGASLKAEDFSGIVQASQKAGAV